MNIKTCSTILIENNYKNKFIILTHNSQRKSWEIPGGYIDPGESVKDGARRELFEETFNLFHLNKKAFQTFFTQNNHATYIINLYGSIFTKYYYENINKINKYKNISLHSHLHSQLHSQSYSHFKETDGITRIPINNSLIKLLKTYKNKQNAFFKDINNNTININHYTIKNIKRAILGSKIFNIKPNLYLDALSYNVKLRKKYKSRNIKNSILDGTKHYI